MKILAIDWGEKGVGFAVGYSQNRMTFPLQGIRRSANQVLLASIRRLVEEYEVQKILVGYPLNRDGSASKTCEKIDRFIRFLEKRLPLSIERVEEHLTSWEAEQNLLSLKKDRRERRRLADCFAAEAIIKNYFGSK